MLYLYICILIILSILNTVFTKKLQLSFSESVMQLSFYTLLVSLFSTINLTVINGLKININSTTLIFSVFYAIISAISMVVNMLALKRVELPVVNIVVTSGNIVITALFGTLILGDKITFKLALAVILILTAILLPYLKLHTTNGKNSILVCAILFLNSGVAVIALKLFTLNKHVTDTNSFYILTNIILVIGSVFFIAFLCLKNKVLSKNLLRTFNKKQVFSIGFLTVINNATAIFTALAIAKMPISSYTIVMSSLSLISATILSRFYFKEKVDKVIIASVILAIAAITANA